MKNCVIIVAGGSGSRMGGETPKQFLPLAGTPVLMHTIRNFHEYDNKIYIVVVIPESENDYWMQLCTLHQFTIPHHIVSGGETRFHSVKNGLAVSGDCDLIAVHDGVRPTVSHQTLSRCFDMAASKGTAVPVLPANESIREGTMDNSRPVDRDRLFLVQTPQVFQAEIIIEAYNQSYSPDFADDASVVEKSGVTVQMVLGNRENIKITWPEDLEIAALFLKTKKFREELD
jgi:2-C-methyl-D-erythritol 4-phosphate cytidylyltransferase